MLLYRVSVAAEVAALLTAMGLSSWSVELLLLTTLIGCSHATNTVPFRTLEGNDQLLTCNLPFATREGLQAFPEVPPRVPISPGLGPGGTDVPHPSGFEPIRFPGNPLLATFLDPGYRRDRLIIDGELPSNMMTTTTTFDPSPLLNEAFSAQNRSAIMQFLTDQGVGQCTGTRQFVSLDATYFPRFYSALSCSGGSCSIPPNELTCQLDRRVSTFTYSPALRFDCCDNFVPQAGRFVRQCGWRRVLVPFAEDCTCDCSSQ